MKSRSVFGGWVFAAASLATLNATAVTVISGFDAGANSSDSRTSSNAAAAAFDASVLAIGSLHLLDFESASVGQFTSLSAAPGVTLTGADRNGAGQSVRNVAQGSPDRLYGYNTTAAGKNFAYVNGGSLTFSFATPVVAFGAYFSGVQFADELISFNDGTAQTVALPFDFSTGGVSFVGFSDLARPISSITFNTIQAANTLGDLVGVDDVRYVVASAAAVPEPKTYALMLAGLGIIGFATRRRKPQ